MERVRLVEIGPHSGPYVTDGLTIWAAGPKLPAPGRKPVIGF